MGIGDAARAARSRFRVRHLWRRRHDARAHARHRQAHPQRDLADAGRASDLRVGDARGNRRHRAAVSRGRRAPHRGAARRSGRRRRHEIYSPSRRLRDVRRTGRRHQAHRPGFRRLGLGLSGAASRQPDGRCRHRHAQGQGRRRRDARHHAVLFRERSLLPLSRPRARARHRHPDRARHPAGAEFQGRDQFRGARRRVGAGLAGRAFPRPR